MQKTSEQTVAASQVQAAPSQVGVIIGLMAPAIMMGLYMAMFSVALPAIRTDFAIEADTAAWVVTIYTLPFMMFMPLYGRLGDSLGKRRLFMAGIVIFLGGTMMAALSPNLGWLMAGRAIQGVGTAGFVPLSIAVITQLFPASERGKAMGTWNSALPLTGIIAPYLGGLLIDASSWRAIFWPIVLVGVVALFVVRRNIPPLPGSGQPDFLRRFDWGGVILLSAFITSLLLYAASRPVTGIAPLQDWRLLIATLALLAAFIYWEQRQPNPYVPLKLFGQQTFTISSVCAGIRMFTMAGIRFLIPLYLVDVHGLSATTIGIVLTAHAIPLFLLLRWGGQLADKWGSRWPVMVSLSIQTGAMLYLGLLPDGVAIGWVVLGVMLQSGGAGLSLAPLHRSSMMGIPSEQTGVAAGMYSMLRFAGTVFGTALCGVVLQQGLTFMPDAAYQLAFWFVAGVTFIGVVLGSRLQV